MAEAQTENPFVNYWAVHSEKDNRPMFRTWARTESDANRRLAEVRAEDGDAAVEYWVMQMTRSELESYKSAGVMPPDA